MINRPPCNIRRKENFHSTFQGEIAPLYPRLNFDLLRASMRQKRGLVQRVELRKAYLKGKEEAVSRARSGRRTYRKGETWRGIWIGHNVALAYTAERIRADRAGNKVSQLLGTIDTSDITKFKCGFARRERGTLSRILQRWRRQTEVYDNDTASCVSVPWRIFLFSFSFSMWDLALAVWRFII